VQVACNLTTSYQDFDFTFTTPPVCTDTVEYYIICWVNNTSGVDVFLGSNGAANNDYYSNAYSYSSFPDPVTLTSTIYGVGCIYATLVDVTPPPTPPTPAVTVKQSILNMGTLAGTGIQVTPLELDWGVIVPGTTKTLTVQIKNRSASAQVLHMAVTQWQKTKAKTLLSIAWNKEGETLGAGLSTTATLTLTAADSTLGDTEFSFGVSITGTA
jgi:hypothetical protein